MSLPEVPRISKLRSLTQEAKSHRTEWNYRIHRRISVYITWFLLHSRISANQVTLLSMASGVGGGLLVLLGDPGTALIGFLGFYGYFLLDKVDGEIARFRNQETLRGICLDYIGHLFIPALVLLSVGGFLARENGWVWFWALGGLGSLTVMFGRVGRDIPHSILIHKTRDLKNLGVFPPQPEDEKAPRIAKKKNAILTSLREVGRALTSFWIGWVLMASGLVVYFFRDSFIGFLTGSYLLVLISHLINTAIIIQRLAGNADKKMYVSLLRMVKVNRTLAGEKIIPEENMASPGSCRQTVNKSGPEED